MSSPDDGQPDSPARAAERLAVEAILHSRAWLHAVESEEAVARRIIDELCDRRWSGDASAIRADGLASRVYGEHRADEAANIRAAVRKVRSMLAEFYAGEGRHEPLRLEIPRRAYRAEFTPAARPLALAPSALVPTRAAAPVPVFAPPRAMAPDPSSRGRRRHLGHALFAAGVLAAVVVLLALRPRESPNRIDVDREGLHVVLSGGKRLPAIVFPCTLAAASTAPQLWTLEDLDEDGILDVAVAATCENTLDGSYASIVNGRTGRELSRVRLDRPRPGLQELLVLSPQRISVGHARGRPAAVLVQATCPDHPWTAFIVLDPAGRERSAYWVRGHASGLFREADLDADGSLEWYFGYRDDAEDAVVILAFDSARPPDGVVPTAWPLVPPGSRQSSHLALALFPRTTLTPRPFKHYVNTLTEVAGGKLRVDIQEGTDDQARGIAWYYCGASFGEIEAAPTDSLHQLSAKLQPGMPRVTEGEMEDRRKSIRIHDAGGWRSPR